MEIFFHDPEDLPVPPEEVRIREFSAKPYPDGRRVRIYLEITPFQQAPDADVSILDEAGAPLASVSVIETIDPKMEMTMHLRGTPPPGIYQVQVRVFYRPDRDEPENGGEPAGPPALPERLIVDQSETTFEVD